MSAILTVTEFRFVGGNGYDQTQIARQPYLANQKIDFTNGEAKSATFNGLTALVRIVSDADCFLKFGIDPNATENDMLMFAGSVEYFGVSVGDKISVIAKA